MGKRRNTRCGEEGGRIILPQKSVSALDATEPQTYLSPGR
jgi:hypothetical protein